MTLTDERPRVDPARPIDPSDYRPDHRDLLLDVDDLLPAGFVVPADASGADAILVPTCRPAVASDGRPQPGLRLALHLAVQFGCPLLVVCSRRAVAAEVAAALVVEDPRVGPLLEVLDLADLPAEDLPWLARLRTPRHLLSSLYRSNDVGTKRNYGLLRARAGGWRHLLLLDDDLSPFPGGESDGPTTGFTLNGCGVRRARAALDASPDLQVVGWTLEDFDDNSVYGHARRAAGEAQQIFIGGGALLLRVTGATPFFPDIYNEDWLFLIALAAAGGHPRAALGQAGRVHQREYWPYRPQRARSEEAGDLLGEGLLNLLEDHGTGFAGMATWRAYWRRALAARSVGVAHTRRELSRQLGTGRLPAGEGYAIRAALEAADQARGRLDPDLLAGYLAAWLRDLADWRALLAPLDQTQAAIAAGPGQVTAAPAAARAVHVPSHRPLLADLTQQRLVTDQRFDAVIVPTVRGPLYLLTAAAVARRAGGTLVLLCSGASYPRRVLAEVSRFTQDVDVVAVDCEGYQIPLHFGCDPIAARLERRRAGRDTATKRNLGLLLARLMGWRHVLFLDDDVRELRTRALRRARAALEPPGCEVAGWAFDQFPDHSVVCHAYRSLPAAPHGEQVPFLGGGGMAVRVGDQTPFFPNVYNEDWLFLAGLFDRAGSPAEPQIGLLGELSQLAYDPFLDPHLAGTQEFGDLLAEGLFRLLPGHLHLAASADYWQTQLQHRGRLIRQVRDQVVGAGPGDRARIEGSLAAAEHARGRVGPQDLVAWVEAWSTDRLAWRDAIAQLPAAGRRRSFADFDQAACQLRLGQRYLRRAGRSRLP